MKNGDTAKSLEEKIGDLDSTVKDYVKHATKEMFRLLERHEELEDKLTQEQMKITNLLISHEKASRPNRLNSALIALSMVMIAITITFAGAGALVYNQFKSFYKEQTISFKQAIADKDTTLVEMGKEFEDYFVKSKEVIKQLQDEIKTLKEK